MGSAAGRSALAAILAGGDGVARTVLKSFSPSPGYRPTAADVADLRSLAGAMDRANMSSAKQVRGVMMGSPKELALKAGMELGLSGIEHIGDRLESNAAHLASALLAARRTAEQERVYGKNPFDTAREIEASRAARDGRNAASLVRRLAGAGRGLLGEVDRRTAAARAMEATQYINAPGAFYSYLNGERSRDFRRDGV